MPDEDKKISKNRERKQEIVSEFSEKVERAKGLVFANYQGLTHKQLEILKKAVKTVEADFVVTKNTLLLRALEKLQLKPEQKKHFKQPTATLFIYNDLVEPIKRLAKMIKELKLPLIKFAVLEGKILQEADVLRLSTLPSKDVLRAQLLGQMKAPISGLHRALSWNMTKFVMTIKAISDKRQTTS